MAIKVGILVPEASPPEAPMPDVAGLARSAEQCGLDGLWVGDRLVVGDWNVPDAGLNLATAAAVTDRITLGFAIYVPSTRPLAWAAKQIAGLQLLVGDRGGLRSGAHSSGLRTARRDTTSADRR